LRDQKKGDTVLGKKWYLSAHLTAVAAAPAAFFHTPFAFCAQGTSDIIPDKNLDRGVELNPGYMTRK
jgi:hypothetical protein